MQSKIFGTLKICRLIENGGQAVVYLVENYKQQQFAAKIYRMNNFNEFNTLRMLKSNKNTIKLLDYVSYNHQQGLLLPFYKNGDLYNFYTERKNYKITRKIIYDIFYSISHCHHNNISHRDIKPSNFLLDNSYNSILCDFGLATNQDNIKTSAGTKPYAAPEVKNREIYKNK